MKGTVLGYERPPDPIAGEYQIDARGAGSSDGSPTDLPARRRARSAGAKSSPHVPTAQGRRPRRRVPETMLLLDTHVWICSIGCSSPPRGSSARRA
jgi:hypothetical protein